MNEEQKDVTDVNEVNPEEVSETGGMSRRKIITGVIAGALVLCIAGGTALYAHNQNGKEAVEAAAIEKEVKQAPVIKVYSESFIVGVNKEINLQEKVIKSITSENKIKSVTLEMVDSSKKDILAVADIKDGKEKSGVPAKTAKFTKEGKYSVNIVVTDSKNITVRTKVSFEVGAELLSYVQGLKDWSVEVKATTVDYMCCGQAFL